MKQQIGAFGECPHSESSDVTRCPGHDWDAD